MKRLSIISFLTAAIAFGFASCADKAEEFKKGAPDSEGCYGVYFPAQKTSLILDPSEPTVDTLKVARTKTEGAITVPYTFKGDSVFTTTELKFEDGQTESYIVVSFDSAQVGTTYKCSFILEDPAYASQYTSNAIAIDLSVTRDKWNSLGNGSYSDIFMFDGIYPVEILQNDKDKTKFRIMHPYDAAMEADDGYSDENKGEPCEYIPLYLLKAGNTLGGVSVTQSDLVYFEESSTGYYHTTYGQTIMINHPAEFSSLRKEEEWLHNKVLQYQENGLPAGIQLAPYYYMNGVGGWKYTTDDGMVTIMLPGGVLTDYSLDIFSDFADEGEQDVMFVFGSDVAFVEFATYEGALNANQIQSKADAIIAGEDSSAVTIDSTCVVTLSFPATGEYTLVAVAYDADSVAQSNESLVLNYVAADDEVPVDVFAELVSTKKYERQGLSSDNCLEYTIYGSDLTDVSVGLFQTLKFNADPEGYIASVIEDEDDEYALSASVIGKINDLGYTNVFGGLNPGTSYTLVVVASNGYEADVTLATATTTGDPLPIFMEFDATDLDEELCPATISGYEKTYDFYAIRYYGESGIRELISTIDLKAVDDSTLMTVGLFGEDSEYYGLHDTIYFSYYEGMLYTLSNAMYGDKGYQAAVRYYCSAGYFSWEYDYVMVGGFVDEDHLAFVDDGSDYGINGWALTAYSDSAWTTRVGNIEVYLNPLFVTSGYYDESLTPVQASTRLDNLSAALNGVRTNHVETDLGYIKSTIENFKNASKYVSCGTKAELESVPEPRSISSKMVSVKAYERQERPFETTTKD